MTFKYIHRDVKRNAISRSKLNQAHPAAQVTVAVVSNMLQSGACQIRACVYHQSFFQIFEVYVFLNEARALYLRNLCHKAWPCSIDNIWQCRNGAEPSHQENEAPSPHLGKWSCSRTQKDWKDPARGKASQRRKEDTGYPSAGAAVPCDWAATSSFPPNQPSPAQAISSLCCLESSEIPPFPLLFLNSLAWVCFVDPHPIGKQFFHLGLLLS